MPDIAQMARDAIGKRRTKEDILLGRVGGAPAPELRQQAQTDREATYAVGPPTERVQGLMQQSEQIEPYDPQVARNLAEKARALGAPTRWQDSLPSWLGGEQ